MKTMKKTILHRTGCAVALTVVALAMAFPAASLGDIYRWEDESGVVHFTDDIGNIPPKFRGRQTPILKGPPESGRPSLSTVSPPTAGPADTLSLPESGATPETPAAPGEDIQGQAEQLRAKIAAKEQFVDSVDRKRSNIANPLGNRFVSPEDLELYAKYKQELPQDRQRLREVEALIPPGK
jgi:hypothetical protein